MSEKKDPPIQEQSYLGGVKVIDIGDIRVARGLSRRPYTSCKHRALVYDTNERRVWCKQCESDVDAFDAFVAIVANFSAKADELEHREEALKQAQAFNIRAIATKVLDDVWRGRKMVPLCPHCKVGLLPEDFTNGVGTYNTQMEKARRNRKAENNGL